MKTLKAIATTLETLRAKSAFNGLSDLDALKLNLDNKVSAFNADNVGKSLSDDAIKAAQLPVKAALDLYNSQVIYKRLNALKAMTGNDGIVEYLRDQSASGLDFSVDDSNNMSLSAKTITVPAYIAIRYAHGSAFMGIVDRARLFANNIAVFDAKSDEAKVTDAPNLSDSYIGMYRDLGWKHTASKLSWNQLEYQLNDLVTAIMGKENAPRMIKADVRFIRTAILQTAKQTHDDIGRYILREDNTILTAIFIAIKTRCEKKAYAMTNKTGVDKAAQSVVVTKEENKAENARNATPDASDVEISLPKTEEVAEAIED